MGRIKGAPSCSSCSFCFTCDDEKKSPNYWCYCYELGDSEIKYAWCSSCKRFLPISEFRKNSSRKSGVRSSCKSCDKIRDNSINGRYKSYKRNARQRGIKFEITKEDFAKIIVKRCKYCGDYGAPYNGIDRVDNNQGYTLQNCVPCCEWCNKIKMSHTVEDMVNHINKMHDCLIKEER